MTVKGMLGGALVCGAVAITGCAVEAYPADYPVADGDYPPAAFIATAEPVYYGGHAAYWYHDHWFYRDGGRWSSYGHEPPELAQRRAQFGGPARVNYARPSARPVARGRPAGRR